MKISFTINKFWLWLTFLTLCTVVIIAGVFYYFSRLPQNFKVEDIQIKNLAIGQHYYDGDFPLIDLQSDTMVKNMNTDNGYYYIYDTVRPYNPTTSSRIILNLIDNYNQTGNQAYLTKAELYTESLLKTKKIYRDAYFFKFEFNYRLQGTADKMFSPWYSGLAQGRALSIFSRLYALTGQEKYLDAARHTFKSFELLRGKTGPWISMVTDDGYLWIEEYTLDKSDFTLNGFLYSIFGLYDYYQIEKTPESEKFLKGALTTAKAYIPKFRHPGSKSYYCLKHKSYNPTYHATHIKQMSHLYKMTGDPFFKEWADIFTKDQKPQSLD